jgi:dTDP-4-amino-4,6-dideoxygalactose transaminase
MKPSTLTLEDQQRLFYSLDEEVLGRILRTVVQEELSVVSGGVLEQFEREAAAFFGARHGVAVCNGTAALHLALFAMDLQPGDEVLIPVYGYYAMALPVCMLGAKPLFCDIREDDLTLDPDDVEKMITPRTRAIITHQPWGCPADPERLRAIADRHDLRLIADVSHALGTLWQGRPLGHYYDYICASMGKGKLISGGELGVVTASTDECRDRMLLYGHVNRVPQGLLTDRYKHIANAVGIKYRPHPFALALALEQMATYPQRSARLVQNVRAFERALGHIPGFTPFATPAPADRVYWRVPFRADARLGEPQEVLGKLVDQGCTVVRIGGVLLHRHSALTEYYGVTTHRRFPAAERVSAQCLQVPAFALYDEEMAARELAGFEALSRSSIGSHR